MDSPTDEMQIIRSDYQSPLSDSHRWFLWGKGTEGNRGKYFSALYTDCQEPM